MVGHRLITLYRKWHPFHWGAVKRMFPFDILKGAFQLLSDSFPCHFLPQPVISLPYFIPAARQRYPCLVEPSLYFTLESTTRRFKSNCEWKIFVTILFICFLSEIDQCNPNPCKNGGTCKNQGSTYQCECTGEFQGKDCEIREYLWPFLSLILGQYRHALFYRPAGFTKTL